MTKTYNDIEAVNRLLEEKERDLELAAKIGQTLLTKNQELSEKNDVLEEQLVLLTEKVNQIKHELSLKDGLLQAFSETADLSLSEESSSSSNDCLQHIGGACALQTKVKDLEEENLKLRLETEQLSAETSKYEEKEQRLVDDCVAQLNAKKKELDLLVEDLLKKTEECSGQKEEITNLLAQVVDLQKRIKIVTLENMELQKHLEASQTAQRELTSELASLKDKHDEMCAMYEQAQEEIRELRRKQKPGAVRHNYMSSSMLSLPSDSLASELESSLRSECDYPPGYSPAERKVHNWKIFETAKAALKAGNSRGSIPGSRSSLAPSVSPSMLNLGHSPPGASSLDMSRNDSGGESASVSTRSSMYFADVEGSEAPSDLAGLNSLYRNEKCQYGKPGIPGSNDLETALRKLSIRRANELNERDFREDEEKRQKERNRTDSDVYDTPGTCRTPDSTLSTGSGLSQFSMTGSNNPYYRLPQKLRIIKPLEGSVTLRQWQQLATPKMDNLFESRPGVATKGERKLDVEVETYNLSDFEEDDDYQECPSKRFEESSTINTVTDSKVRHPSDYSSDEEETLSECDKNDPRVTPTSFTSRMATGHQSHNNATSTFSVSMGLASILNERDLFPPSKDPKCKSELAGNPERVDSIVSDSHFEFSKITTSSTYTSQTESRTEVSTGLSLPTSGTDTPELRLPHPSATPYRGLPFDHLNQGTHVLMDTLKHTGYSVLNSRYLGGILGSQKKETDTGPSSVSTTQNPVSSTADKSDVIHVTAGSMTKTEVSRISSLFGRALPGGVSGALTQLRQNGIF
ncbi:trafficking kinesin-binding protein 1-like isoform X1 [Saccostrea echinata]|uniref:trafficking kinesin-binding protein 1-like isoform X1 n=1 Tax=Saccostrea echinata TaxID=191078 RepID=UPI002A7F64DA|nr:trafficking kinesin-binding protein 1-like isoform X1 [Saccostrea echinata]XP_061165449.1 trafficking kinesin-binding protein 1-like isoform X1 [Saccostrea echinata]